jgi:hypothetical protein
MSDMTITARTPMTHDEWVQLHLKQMRAERRQRQTLIFGAGGVNRARLTDDQGERIIVGPTGRPVRVIEYVGGNQVEQWDDKLHAVVRPAVHFKFGQTTA